MDASHKMSAPLQKPPNFDNFKITEDLNAVAKMKEAFAEYGVTGNIDFSGIKNAEVLEPFLNQLKIIKADTGFVIKNIQALDIIDDDPCCIACYNPVAQRFYISRKYFNSKEALEATLNNWADNGILPKQARTVAYLAEHETAHMRIPDEILNSADARRIRNRFMDSPNSYLNDEKTTEFFADSVATCRISNGKVHKEMKKAVKFLEERGIK